VTGVTVDSVSSSGVSGRSNPSAATNATLANRIRTTTRITLAALGGTDGRAGIVALNRSSPERLPAKAPGSKWSARAPIAGCGRWRTAPSRVALVRRRHVHHPPSVRGPSSSRRRSGRRRPGSSGRLRDTDLERLAGGSARCLHEQRPAFDDVGLPVARLVQVRDEPRQFPLVEAPPLARRTPRESGVPRAIAGREGP